MRTDLSNWCPYSVEQVSSLFKGADFTWAIAGGWAIDLFIGRQTREHDDIDIMILSSDLSVLYDYLSEYRIYKAKKGMLEIWDGQPLDDSYSLWISEEINSPFVFEIMLIEVDSNNWYYKRNKTIYGSINELFMITKADVLIILPEIQLLYKLDSDSVRAKDIADFKAVCTYLDINQKKWLYNHLKPTIINQLGEM